MAWNDGEWHHYNVIKDDLYCDNEKMTKQDQYDFLNHVGNSGFAYIDNIIQIPQPDDPNPIVPKFPYKIMTLRELFQRDGSEANVRFYKPINKTIFLDLEGEKK